MRCPESFSLQGLRRLLGGLTPARPCFSGLPVGAPTPAAFFTPAAPSAGDPLRCNVPPFATEVPHAHPRHRTPLRLGPARRPPDPRHPPRLPGDDPRPTPARRPPSRPGQGPRRLPRRPPVAGRPADHLAPPHLLQRLPRRAAPQPGAVPPDR